MTNYQTRVAKRSPLRYFMGLFVRMLARFLVNWRLSKMRRAGAVVGQTSVICKEVRFTGYANLKVGEHSTLLSGYLDTRSSIDIGDNVIVGSDVSVITCSHDIDSVEWEFKSYGIRIDDYVWIATGAKILPGCRRIGRGAVVGAYAVVASDIPPMAVVVGNPAKIVRYRRCVHENIVPEAFLGGDLLAYRSARKSVKSK